VLTDEALYNDIYTFQFIQENIAMKNLSKILASISLLFFLSIVSLQAQSENRETRSRLKDALNPKWTVIIDYIDSFEDNKARRKPKKKPPPPEVDNTHLDGHFELIGGVWSDSIKRGVVDSGLVFSVDLRLFPDGSGPAILAAFTAWELETTGLLVGDIIFEDVMLGFGDGDSTYTMRNLGGGGVLAATFITWDDTNDDSEINNAELFIEMDVVHNSTAQRSPKEKRRLKREKTIEKRKEEKTNTHRYAPS